MRHLSNDQTILNRKFIIRVLFKIFSDPFHNPFVSIKEHWPPHLRLQKIFILVIFLRNK
jgi:hypothetical protein